MKINRRRFVQILVVVILAALSIAGSVFWQNVMAAPENVPSPADTPLQDKYNTNDDSILYLPLLMYNYPWVSPFGAEAYHPIVDGSTMLEKAADLNMKWTRMGTQVSWRELQPNQGSAIQWHLLSTFEDELRALRSEGITAIVTIKDWPHWAVDPNVRTDGQPTSCGPILPEHFDEFAIFLTQLVNRYKTAEFNVRDWELGNEPDVDPNLVPPDYILGCWGDMDDDEYYGGQRYGEMLKAVTPAIKGADPGARVHIGGLLLSSPNSDATFGRPELFLRGVLAAGAAPYFDVVSYHWHPSYWQVYADYDNAANSPWDSWGGGAAGKPRYLRQLMSDFDVDKQIFLNEVGFGCKEENAWCTPPIDPDDQFFQNQADQLVRSNTRALSENVMGVIWYTLTGPGWRESGLLDENQDPRPAYFAYQNMIAQLQYGRYNGMVDYGAGIEGYEFIRKLERVDIIWAINPATVDPAQAIDVLVPDAKFIAAYDRDGALLNPPLVGDDRQLSVGFSPVYIIRHP